MVAASGGGGRQCGGAICYIAMVVTWDIVAERQHGRILGSVWLRAAKCRRGCTYHSPLGSVRAEPALLPAAAEAKEAGAIVVAGEAWKVRCDVEAVSFVLGGTRQTVRGSCGWIVSGRRWCQAASRVGWSGGRGKSGTRGYWYRRMGAVVVGWRQSRRYLCLQRESPQADT